VAEEEAGVEVATGRAPFLRSDAAWGALSDQSEVAGTSPATTVPPQSFRSRKQTRLAASIAKTARS
jgi:hypothetical protein